MTTLTSSVSTDPVAVAASRHRIFVGAAWAVAGACGLVIFGLSSRTAHGVHAIFGLNLLGVGGIHVPDLRIPAGPAALVLCAICIALGLVRMAWPLSRVLRILATTAYIAALTAAFLIWATAAQSLNFAAVLGATVAGAVPLTFGALGGVLCERSGVINVAIEGQFLFGAFGAAFAASVTGSLWAGLVAGCLGGALLGAVLAVFANRYKVEQVVLGVVLNLLAAGLTGFLYDRLLQQNAGFNKALAFPAIRIPGLADIPVIGPVLFDQNILVYLAMVLVAVVHFGLFHTRWGLRTRAVGEHPTAADTVGIRVLGTRYRNVIIAGLVAGLGGVWLTIGLNIPFNKGMSAGLGFIALAALIFGRWTPLGATSAALLFGFANGVSTSLQPLGTPVPTQFLSMAPYLATIVAVAGLVGHVRAPAADGQPYLKG
jgi:general nucleoside transport system permease protein